MSHNTLVRNPVTRWQPVPSAWTALTPYVSSPFGSLVTPTTAHANGFMYQCTSPGTSGSLEPTWPTTIGGTVADGSLIWTCFSTTAILVSELEALDQGAANAPNGVDGSTHGPTAPIIIGGSGLQVTGPVAIARSGSITVTASGGIVLAGGNVPQYGPGHAGRTATVVHPLVGGRPASRGTWRVRHTDGGVQPVASTVDFSDGNGPQAARWVVPLRMRDAATVTSIVLTFRVGWPHTALPMTLPGARLIRFGSSGIPQSLCSSAAGADSAGFVYAAKPGSPSLWTGQQTITITCDQNNVIDVGTYTYALEIIEEQGLTGYPWALIAKPPVRLATTPGFGNPHGTGYPIDGVTVNAGDRVLVKDSIFASGIMVAVTGASWTPASDFTSPTDFTQGVVVPVTSGAMNGGSYWQAASNQTSWIGASSNAQLLSWVARGPDDDETSQSTATQFFGHGNIFQAVAVSYAGITQQVFQ